MPSTEPRIGIWGFGKEGRVALTWAVRVASAITVVNESDTEPDDFPHEKARYAGRDLNALLDCDLVVLSPGVPKTHPFLATLAGASIQITSGTGLWLRDNAFRTIGITGTKGKSTTAALTHRILVNSGIDAIMAGNIGQPLLELPPGDITVVAELSSYQCARLDHSPVIAVVTNLFEEHIPWHGSVAEYWADKARIFTRGAKYLVCDQATKTKFADIGLLDDRVSIHVVDDVPVDSAMLPPPLRAPHNLHNVQCAMVAAGLCADLAPNADLLSGYDGLPHRLEIVAAGNGVAWVDDTLSTTPESVIAAAEAFRDGDVVLIVGGQSRGISYQVLTDYLCAHADTTHVIAIPTNGAAVTREFAERFPDRRHVADSLAHAVTIAAHIARPGTTVILSPGAPSFDFFRDYADKTKHFADAVDAVCAN
jgi:UDP-N-acetylmuramoylalanine--D-glutamate ligase